MAEGWPDLVNEMLDIKGIKTIMNDGMRLGEYMLPPEASYKEATGPYQVKLFCTGEDGPLYPVGSGTLLNINNRNFIITCWHVIEKASNLEKVVFYEPTPDEKVRPIRSSTIYVFKDEDIAFLEIEPSYVPYLKTKQVANYNLINNNVTLHLTSVSTVILHAVPYERIDLSFEKKEITLNTFPYVTFAKEIKNDFIDIDINRKGKNELGEEAIVPDIYGMSGSGVWTLHPGEDTTYRLAGIITNGRTDSGSVYALDINFVVGLLTTHLRENEG